MASSTFDNLTRLNGILLVLHLLCQGTDTLHVKCDFNDTSLCGSSANNWEVVQGLRNGVNLDHPLGTQKYSTTPFSLVTTSTKDTTTVVRCDEISNQAMRPNDFEAFLQKIEGWKVVDGKSGLGPKVDHTKGTSDGRYAGLTDGNNKLRLLNGISKMLCQPICLSFYYFLSNASLDVTFDTQAGNSTVLATITSYSATGWHQAKVTLRPDRQPYIYTLVGRAQMPPNFLAVDDIIYKQGECSSAASSNTRNTPTLISCEEIPKQMMRPNNFEKYRTYSTGLKVVNGSSGLGPTVDHTSGTSAGRYAVWPGRNGLLKLLSHWTRIPCQPICLSLYYFMSVSKALSDAGLDITYRTPNGKLDVLKTISSYNTTDWQLLKVTLRPGKQPHIYDLRKRISDSETLFSLAVDDISYSKGECIPVGDADFDHGHDDYYIENGWEMTKHTSSDNHGSYMSVRVSSDSSERRARLTSPLIHVDREKSCTCLSFQYQLSDGELRVSIIGQGEAGGNNLAQTPQQWSLDSSTRGMWRQFSAYHRLEGFEQYKIRFEGSAADGAVAAAVDNIKMESLNCPTPSTSQETTTYEPANTTNFNSASFITSTSSTGHSLYWSPTTLRSTSEPTTTPTPSTTAESLTTTVKSLWTTVESPSTTVELTSLATLPFTTTTMAVTTMAPIPSTAAVSTTMTATETMSIVTTVPTTTTTPDTPRLSTSLTTPAAKSLSTSPTTPAARSLLTTTTTPATRSSPTTPNTPARTGLLTTTNAPTSTAMATSTAILVSTNASATSTTPSSTAPTTAITNSTTAALSKLTPTTHMKALTTDRSTSKPKNSNQNGSSDQDENLPNVTWIISGLAGLLLIILVIVAAAIVLKKRRGSRSLEPVRTYSMTSKAFDDGETMTSPVLEKTTYSTV